MSNSHSGLRVSVVVPAVNEAKNLPYVLPHIAQIADEVVLVDGRSIDDTVAVARAILPNAKIIQQVRRGKGDALRCGFAHCEGDIIVMIDADGSNDPGEIPQFVQALVEGADFAKGSRFLSNGRARGGSADITPFRAVGNRILSWIVNILFGTRYTDLCYGYNAFWRRSLEYLQFECDGFEVETALTLSARKAALTIVEVPSFEHARIHGASNLNAIADGWYVLKTILHERFTSGPAFHGETLTPPASAQLARELVTSHQEGGSK